MSRFRFLLPVLLGLGFWMMNPLEASAQRGGHGGHGGGMHSGGGMHRGGGVNPGARGFSRGGGVFYGGIYPGFYNPAWYGYYPPYNNYYYSAYPPAPYNYVAPVAPLVPVQPLNHTAEIDVLLPRADAKVWVDGNLMTEGSGTFRAFMSPELEPGYSYSYRITAAWMDNGQEVRVERTVPVSPGRVSKVDFAKVNTAP